MKVVVVGSGYVGLATGACLSGTANKVYPRETSGLTRITPQLATCCQHMIESFILLAAAKLGCTDDRNVRFAIGRARLLAKP
jgi:UDP-glucose 6-dehydrogenase